jgi:hypothetical protein
MWGERTNNLKEKIRATVGASRDIETKHIFIYRHFNAEYHNLKATESIWEGI